METVKLGKVYVHITTEAVCRGEATARRGISLGER